MRYLGLQHYEPGMQYDAHECLLQLLAKIYPSINDDCMFKIDKPESTLCNDMVTLQMMMVYVLIGPCIERMQAIFKQVGCYISLWIQGENN